MLKLFEKYKGVMLAVFMVVLMVAFLIQPTLSIFMPDPTKQKIGRLPGETLIAQDEIDAASKLNLMEGLDRIRAREGQRVDAWLYGNDPLRWLLLMHDAKENLGLWVSDAEVDAYLIETFGEGAWVTDKATRQATANEFGASVAGLRETVREMLIARRYSSLVVGTRYVPQGEGVPFDRLSDPLRERLAYDLSSQVSGFYTVIPAAELLSEVEEPSATDIEQLFAQYQDVLPEDSPEGFGYRYPDQVKIEYIVVSPADFRVTALPTPVEQQAFYEANIGQYGDDLYAARARVVADWQRAQTFERVSEVARDIQRQMEDPLRSVTQAEGYYVLPEGYEPVSMQGIAEEIQQAYGVSPRVSDPLLAADWTPVREVVRLPALVGTSIEGMQQGQSNLSLYLASAKEFEPGVENLMAAWGLQVGVPGRQLIGLDGSRVLFRLVDVRQSHAPRSSTEVIDQVRRDAKLRVAYNALTLQRDAILARLSEQGLDSLADAYDMPVLPFTVTQRAFAEGGRLTVPAVSLLGSQQAFVEAVFETATGESVDGQLAARLEAERSGAVLIENQRALALYRVDGFEPFGRDQYAAFVSGGLVDIYLSGVAIAPHDDPLSLEVLIARTGYVSVDDRDDDEPEADES